MPSWAARAAALARGAGHPDALSEGAIPPLPLELRSLCKGAWHRYASGGAVPLLPHEMRRCELKKRAWACTGKGESLQQQETIDKKHGINAKQT